MLSSSLTSSPPAASSMGPGTWLASHELYGTMCPVRAWEQYSDAGKESTRVVQKELLGVQYKLDTVPRSRAGVDTRTGVDCGTNWPTKTQATSQAQHSGPKLC